MLICLAVTSLAHAAAPASIGPPGGNFSALAYVKEGIILAGTQSGRLFYTNSSGRDWRDITPPSIDSHYIIEQINYHAKSDTVYLAVRNLKLGFVMKGALEEITAQPPQWHTLMAGIPIRSLAITADNPPVIYIGTDNRLFYSADGGLQWVITAYDFPDPQIESMIIDPDRNEVIYAGTWQRAFKSTDGGKHWSPVHNGMAPDSDIFTMLFDRDKNLYAGTCGYVYESSDRGLNWKKVLAGFKGKRIHALRLAPNNIVIAGGDTGIYWFDKSNAVWRQIVQNVVVHDLAVMPDGQIFGATYGEGIIACRIGESAVAHMNNGLNASSPWRMIKTDAELVVGLVNQDFGGGLWSYANNKWENLDLQLSDYNIKDFVKLDTLYFVGTTDGITIASTKAATRQVKLLEKKSITALRYIKASELIVAGTLEGLFFITLPGFDTQPIPFFNDKKINCIWAAETEPERIYVGCDEGLYFYSARYQNWLKADFHIDDLIVNCISGDEERKHLFVATEAGLFESDDKALTFSRQTKNLPDVQCQWVTITSREVFALFNNHSVSSRPLNDFEWSSLAKLSFNAWSLAASESGKKLYVGAEGYGVIELQLNGK